jgi:hypothetical protein
MKRKNPEDLLISYPTKRASPGVFYWLCPRHGMTVFSTAGAGVCRCCIADAQKKTKDRRNAAQRVRSAAKKQAAMARVTEADKQEAANASQRSAYLEAMAAKTA